MFFFQMGKRFLSSSHLFWPLWSLGWVAEILSWDELSIYRFFLCLSNSDFQKLRSLVSNFTRVLFWGFDQNFSPTWISSVCVNLSFYYVSIRKNQTHHDETFEKKLTLLWRTSFGITLKTCSGLSDQVLLKFCKKKQPSFNLEIDNLFRKSK